MKLLEETIMQIKVYEFVKQNTDLPFYHFPLEGKRNPMYAKILKRQGMIPGVSDIFLPRGNAFHKGVWIELKTLAGKISPAQTVFMNQMIDEGYLARVCYSAEEAIQLIKDFYDLDPMLGLQNASS